MHDKMVVEFFSNRKQTLKKLEKGYKNYQNWMPFASY